MQTCHNAFKCFPVNFKKSGVSYRKEYKLLFNCHLHNCNRSTNLHFTIETAVHSIKYHLHNYNRDSHLHK